VSGAGDPQRERGAAAPKQVEPAFEELIDTGGGTLMRCQLREHIVERPALRHLHLDVREDRLGHLARLEPRPAERVEVPRLPPAAEINLESGAAVAVSDDLADSDVTSRHGQPSHNTPLCFVGTRKCSGEPR
jgi:hypothetical protein